MALVDFAELEHYIDVLEEAADCAERRDQAAQTVCSLVESAEPLAAASRVILAVQRYGAWGRPFDGVRAAFTELTTLNAGLSAQVSVKRAEQEKKKREGTQGGRPPSPWVDDWRRLVDAKQTRNPNLSRTEAIKGVAREWVDDKGSGRSWTTIRDAISPQKPNGKPGFHE